MLSKLFKPQSKQRHNNVLDTIVIAEDITISLVIDALEQKYDNTRVSEVLKNILNIQLDGHKMVDCYSIQVIKGKITVAYSL